MIGEIQQSELVLINQMSKEQLAEVMAELIKSNPKVISALYNVICSCPNLVVEY